jgi:hypothetical protein
VLAAGDSKADGVVVHRGAYVFDESGRRDDFIPQHVAPEQVVKSH